MLLFPKNAFTEYISKISAFRYALVTRALCFASKALCNCALDVKALCLTMSAFNLKYQFIMHNASGEMPLL